jgi:hypothetical protein
MVSSTDEASNVVPKHHGGRPATGRGKHTAVTVPNALVKAITGEAESLGLSYSANVRRILTLYAAERQDAT